MLFTPSSSPTAIVIVGPTASGKTSLSLSVAQHFESSIISADSRQCYSEMNIGVAKPSPSELALCSHYFINTHSIHDPVDAAVFEREALAATQDIFKKNNIAVIAGGTGLYVKIFCEGMDDIPPTDPAIKEQVNAVWEEAGLAGIQRWLNEVDPDFLMSSKEPGNRARMMRALEVKLSSGKSLLELREGVKKIRPFQVRKIGIRWTRDLLYQRINQRVDEMMAAGLQEEAAMLYPYRHLKALQTVGYQELFDHFEKKYSIDEAVEKIKQHTRNFAKRQMTWFTKDKDIIWAEYDQLMEEISH